MNKLFLFLSMLSSLIGVPIVQCVGHALFYDH